MTNLDLTPAGLRKLADACDKWSYEFAAMEDGTDILASTLRALADQLESNPPQDVVNLVIAARNVAFGEPDTAALKALDRASEAFSERVPWEEEPDEQEEA